MSSSMSPGRFGSFVLLERLGRGGMGEVWLGHTVGPAPELCVVKTVRAELSDDEDLARRFADEARLALLLVHPRISRVLDAGTVGQTRYLALGLVEGVDVQNLLRRMVERQESMAEEVAIWIALCALDALSFAHTAKHPLTGESLGVVHRDISPANIMCGSDGFARVIDFGLALSSLKQARTEQNVVMGKIAYMSPEQARGQRIDVRADIFAMGVVLYELLTGSRFWGTRTQQEIWLEVGRGDYVPAALPRLAPDVQAVLGMLLERDPAKRPVDTAFCRVRVADLLAARGGAANAKAKLKDLVERLATPELERAASARARMASLAHDAPTEVMEPTQDRLPTTSLAVAEAAAVAAALAAPTLQLDLTELVEQRRRTLDQPAWHAPTVLVERAADVSATQTARRAKNRSFVAALAGGGAAAVAIAIAIAVLALRGSPPAPTPPATPPPPTPVAPTPVAPTPVPPAPVAPPAPAAAPVLPSKAELLVARIEELAGCRKQCVRILRGARGFIPQKTDRQLDAIEKTIQNCQDQCRAR